MKNTLLIVALLLAGGAAFAAGDMTAARGAGADIGSAIGTDPKTGLAYLRVFVVNRADGGPAKSMAAPGTSLNQTVTLTEGSTFAIGGTLKSASAVGRPCDLIVFENGESKIVPISPAGTALNDMPVNGTVSASGNPLGYSCSIELRYAAP